MRIEIIASGRLKKGPYYELCQEFTKRLSWTMTFHEIDHQSSQEFEKKLNTKLNPDSLTVALDETGRHITSQDFAKWIENKAMTQGKTIQFLIGEADGLPDSIVQQASLVLSFGRMTWPHMMARAMLTEQIYRAEKILSGHPYHKQ